MAIFSGVAPFSDQPIAVGDLEDDAKAVIGIKDKDIVLAMSEEALFKYDVKESIEFVDKISVEHKRFFQNYDIKQFDDERVVFGGIDKVYLINFEFFILNTKTGRVTVLKSDDLMGLFYTCVPVEDNIIVLGQSIGYLKCIKY